MITKIRAKQLHEDVKDLIGFYGQDFFWSKEDLISSEKFWSGLTGSGFAKRIKLSVPSGASYVTADISSYNFSSKPFVNYSLISPSGNSSFYITQAYVNSLTGIDLFFSETINQSGYEVDLIFGTHSNVFFINQISQNPIISDITNPALKYEIAVSGGMLTAIPL